MMSTAVAMQDMPAPGNNYQEPGAVRHRKLSKTGSKPNASTEISHAEDEWLNTPHDSTSSNLPLDTNAFQPTNTYWVTPHSNFAREIDILDLTSEITVPYIGLTDAYVAHVRSVLKDHSYTPILRIMRSGWFGMDWSIRDDQDVAVAEWKHPWTSVGEASLIFTPESPHSSHPLLLTNKRWGSRSEKFVHNSIPFCWEVDNLWFSANITLFKIFGNGDNERRVEVAKYTQKWWSQGFMTGGTLVVNQKEVDGVVACLTLCVVLKKKRQRASERNGSIGTLGAT